MKPQMVINGNALIPVRLMVVDADDSNAPLTNTPASDQKLSDILVGSGLVTSTPVGTFGTVSKVAVIPVAAGATPTKAEYDAMRAALIATGLMAAS